MMLSTSQRVVVAFTAVLLTFVVFPRLFGGGTRSKETRGFDPRYHRKGGPGPGVGKGPGPGPGVGKGPAEPTLKSMQQMKMMMEQELKGPKSNSKGYAFTLMPLYAIGVGLFAAYKFLKIKSADDSQAHNHKAAKGAKKSEETENQLNELEQRLAQTEKMLNSILTQLDPLTNCVKSVAMEQKSEIMSQLQSIRDLMRKRGMDCPPVNTEEPFSWRNLEGRDDSLTPEYDTVHSEWHHTKPSVEQEEEDTVEEMALPFPEETRGEEAALLSPVPFPEETRGEEAALLSPVTLRRRNKPA